MERLTVGKFMKIMSEMVENGVVKEDQVLEIRTFDPSVGPSAAVGITSIHPGIDWDRGRIMIYPDVPLVTYRQMRK